VPKANEWPTTAGRPPFLYSNADPRIALLVSYAYFSTPLPGRRGPRGSEAPAHLLFGRASRARTPPRVLSVLKCETPSRFAPRAGVSARPTAVDCRAAAIPGRLAELRARAWLLAMPRPTLAALMFAAARHWMQRPSGQYRPRADCATAPSRTALPLLFCRRLQPPLAWCAFTGTIFCDRLRVADAAGAQVLQRHPACYEISGANPAPHASAIRHPTRLPLPRYVFFFFFRAENR